MKKILYLLLFITLVGGGTFLLGNTDLFKGSFDERSIVLDAPIGEASPGYTSLDIDIQYYADRRSEINGVVNPALDLIEDKEQEAKDARDATTDVTDSTVLNEQLEIALNAVTEIQEAIQSIEEQLAVSTGITNDLQQMRDNVSAELAEYDFVQFALELRFSILNNQYEAIIRLKEALEEYERTDCEVLVTYDPGPFQSDVTFREDDQECLDELAAARTAVDNTIGTQSRRLDPYGGDAIDLSAADAQELENTIWTTIDTLFDEGYDDENQLDYSYHIASDRNDIQNDLDTLEEELWLFQEYTDGLEEFLTTAEASLASAQASAEAISYALGQIPEDAIVRVHVRNSHMEAIRGLTKFNFAIEEGDRIVNVSEAESYELDGVTQDVHVYEITIAEGMGQRFTVQTLGIEGYVNRTNNTRQTATIASEAAHDEIVPRFGHKVLLEDESGASITNASVSYEAGGTYRGECRFVEGGGQDNDYGCEIPLITQDDVFYYVTADGYDPIEGLMADGRYDYGDDQVETTIVMTRAAEPVETPAAACEAITIRISPDELYADQDEPGQEITVTVEGTASNPEWNGELLITSDGDGDFDRNNIIVNGESFSEAVTYTDSDQYIDTEFNASIIGEETDCTSATVEITERPEEEPDPIEEPDPTPEPTTPVECDDPFTDIGDRTQWPGKYVCAAYPDLFKGKTRTTFDPFANITIAEWAAVVSRLGGYDESDFVRPTGFADVSGEWYEGNVGWLQEQGVVRVEDFGPYFNGHLPIHRGYATLLVIRMAGETSFEFDIDFDDVEDDYYAAYAIAIASDTFVDFDGENMAVIQGYDDGSFRPFNYMTRAEAAALSLRALLAWFEDSGIEVQL